MKRTFQPSNLVRKRRHGFFARKATVGGRIRVLGYPRSRDLKVASLRAGSRPCGSPRGTRCISDAEG